MYCFRITTMTHHYVIKASKLQCTDAAMTTKPICHKSTHHKGSKTVSPHSLVNGRPDILTHPVRLDGLQLSDAGDVGQSRLDLRQVGDLASTEIRRR